MPFIYISKEGISKPAYMYLMKWPKRLVEDGVKTCKLIFYKCNTDIFDLTRFTKLKIKRLNIGWMRWNARRAIAVNSIGKTFPSYIHSPSLLGGNYSNFVWTLFDKSFISLRTSQVIHTSVGCSSWKGNIWGIWGFCCFTEQEIHFSLSEWICASCSN